MTKGTRRFLARAVVLLMVVSAIAAAPLSKKDRESIEMTSRAFAEAFKAGNAARIATLYTKDAILMPPDAPAVEGPEAIAAFMATFPPVTAITLENVEVEGLGEGIAFVRGIFTMTTAPVGEEPATTIRGKYLEIRRRQPDGRWLFHRDMFSMDAPGEH